MTESNAIEYFSPCTWNDIERSYKEQGMTKPIRFRVCTGKEGMPHFPILLEPSNEDLYEGPDVVKCRCNRRHKPRLARDCHICCEKCRQCGILRKNTLAFDYLPFTPIIAKECESRSTCYAWLEIWRQKLDWLGKSVDYTPPCISQMWHGKKMRKIQDFFNPNAQYELPIRCSGPICDSVFRTFPTKCTILQENWNEDLQKYQFSCPTCDTHIEVSPSFAKVSF